MDGGLTFVDTEYSLMFLMCALDNVQGVFGLAPKALGYLPGLFLHCGETWRVGRQTLTPSFSAMKMKLVCTIF